MKLAGRKRRSCNTIPWAAITGFISARARSSPAVTSSVFAPYWPEIIIMTPGLPSIAASNLRLRSIHHRGDIPHPDRDAVLMNQGRLAQLRRRQGLALSLEYDPLFRAFDESSASNAGGSSRGGEYIVDREVERRETVGHDLDL